MASSANHHGGADAVIDDPAVAFPAKFVQGHPRLQVTARSREQVMIELAAADAITDRMVERRANWAISDQARAKPGNRLESPPAAVVSQVDAEFVNHGWGDPAGAYLISGKRRLVEHEHVKAARA